MQPEIRTLPDRPIVLVERPSLDNIDFRQAVQKAWATMNAYIDRFDLRSQTRGYFAIASHDAASVPVADLPYVAGYFLVDGAAFPADPDVQLTTLPASRTAVFRLVGPYELLPQTWNAIYREWLPASGELLSELPPYEVYLEMPDNDPSRYVTEICVPIK